MQPSQHWKYPNNTTTRTLPQHLASPQNASINLLKGDLHAGGSVFEPHSKGAKFHAILTVLKISFFALSRLTFWILVWKFCSYCHYFVGLTSIKVFLLRSIEHLTFNPVVCICHGTLHHLFHYWQYILWIINRIWYVCLPTSAILYNGYLLDTHPKRKIIFSSMFPSEG